MLLSQYTYDKNNNFNLIRLIAAMLVLVGHSFALLRYAEPLSHSLRTSAGAIALDVFFIASGFLVSGSLLQKQSLRDYFLARVLRIYPALLVMLILTVFGFGLAMSKFPVWSYLQNRAVYSYLYSCITLIPHPAYILPGVFENNPYPLAVNGSLWSLSFELEMYIIFGAVYLLCQLLKSRFKLIFTTLVLLALAWSLFFNLENHFQFKAQDQFYRLGFMFSMGVMYALWQDKIQLKTRYFLLSLGVLVSTGLFALNAFFVAYQFCLAYVLFYLVYVPKGRVRNFNRFGDYSYGVYIYAFPIQQSVIALMPEISVLCLTLVSMAFTFLLAVLSWHVIEKPALKFKTRLLDHAK